MLILRYNANAMDTSLHDSETPAEGQQVITVTAFIHRTNRGKIEVFLPKRAPTKKFLPGVFELPGGHIDFGESLTDALHREIKEEFDMDIAIGDCFAAFTYLNEVKKSHSVEIIFFAYFTGDLNNLTINPEDHSEYRWATEDEISLIAADAKANNDPEIQAIKKGFALLNGKPVFFG